MLLVNQSCESHVEVIVSHFWRRTAYHLFALGCGLRCRLLTVRKVGFTHDKLFHLFLQFQIDGFLVLYLLLIHLSFFSLDGQLLAHEICTFFADLTHLAFFQMALKLFHSRIELLILFLYDHTLLVDSEELSLNIVELVAQSLKLRLFLLVSAYK